MGGATRYFDRQGHKVGMPREGHKHWGWGKRWLPVNKWEPVNPKGMTTAPARYE